MASKDIVGLENVVTLVKLRVKWAEGRLSDCEHLLSQVADWSNAVTARICVDNQEILLHAPVLKAALTDQVKIHREILCETEKELSKVVKAWADAFE